MSGINNLRLLEVLADFARTLVTSYRLPVVLDKLCVDVADILPITAAGVMMEDSDGSLRFVASSDGAIQRVETLQIELGEGPCQHAYETGDRVVIPDLGTSSSWLPRFAPRALEAGMRSVFSFPMRVDSERLGALNLYSSERIELDDDALHAAQLLTDCATGYILCTQAVERTSRLAAQLQEALDSRVIIEQAKGILAERLDVDPHEAFDRLRAYARGHGLNLHDVADDVVRGALRIDE